MSKSMDEKYSLFYANFLSIWTDDQPYFIIYPTEHIKGLPCVYNSIVTFYMPLVIKWLYQCFRIRPR